MKAKALKCRPNMKFPILAWLIMIVQGMMPWRKGSYSHMAIEFDGKYFDITGAGVKQHSKEQFLKKYTVVESHEINKDITVYEFYEWFDKHDDKDYDHLQIVGLFLKSIGFFSFNKIGYNFKRLICNELPIAYLAHFCNFKFKDSDNFDLINTWKIVKEH